MIDINKQQEIQLQLNTLKEIADHYRIANVRLTTLITTMFSSEQPHDLLDLLVSELKHLYKVDSLAVLNDNLEMIHSNNYKENIPTARDNTLKTSIILISNTHIKLTIASNNIVYNYIYLKRSKPFANHEISTMYSLIITYTSIHINKLMLIYLSKLVITSTDAINFDPKTKAYSIRALQNDYEMLAKTPHTYVFADLDYFKKVNDTYGHDVGDEVLIKFAEYLIRCADKVGGKAYRYGGEEFVIITQTAMNNVYHDLDNTRKAFSKEIFTYNDTTFNVTVSIGMYRGKQGEDAKMCLAKADSLLYTAKESGRNRICY